MIWLFSGEQGEQYGYTDGFRDDEGTYWYTGEGQIGDMALTRGNFAIRHHQELGKSLHLFDYVSTGYVKYVGEASYTDHHTEIGRDKLGNLRDVIVFELELSYPEDVQGVSTPAETIPIKVSALWKQPLDQLRQLASSRAPTEAPPAQKKATAHTRSAAVRVYVLRRSEGKCEGCRSPAPFFKPGGEPYLEAHHIRRLADKGPDHPNGVIALCPNCHRRVHHGADGAEYNSSLLSRVAQIESSFGGSVGTLTLALA
jgi:5-methylcytosine-specific restriction protein A